MVFRRQADNFSKSTKNVAKAMVGDTRPVPNVLGVRERYRSQVRQEGQNASKQLTYVVCRHLLHEVGE